MLLRSFNLVFLMFLMLTISLEGSAQGELTLESRSFTFTTAFSDGFAENTAFSIEKFNQETDGILVRVTVSGSFAGSASANLKGRFDGSIIPVTVGAFVDIQSSSFRFGKIGLLRFSSA